MYVNGSASVTPSDWLTGAAFDDSASQVACASVARDAGGAGAPSFGSVNVWRARCGVRSLPTASTKSGPARQIQTSPTGTPSTGGRTGRDGAAGMNLYDIDGETDIMCLLGGTCMLVAIHM